MSTRFARFVVECGGVFIKSELVKIFLSKIDKRLPDFATPRIIINYEGRARLAQAYAKVQRCNKALCEHNVTDMVS